MATPTVIEVNEGHDVTESAISCNLGFGLMESMRIAPAVYKTGDLIDVVVRMRVGEVAHKPVHKDDFDGPYRRIQKCKALAVSPTTSAQVGKLLDHHIAQVSLHKELPGQTSIDDEITGRRKAKAKDASKKAHPSKRPSRAKAKPADVDPEDSE